MSVPAEAASADGDMELYDLCVVVDRVEGRPVCGLGPGDRFTVTGSNELRIPEGRHFCMYALGAVLPLLAAKQRRLPSGDWLERDSEVACPDPPTRGSSCASSAPAPPACDRRT